VAVYSSPSLFVRSCSFVLQPDRRQVQDRRMCWRGGRRVTDFTGFAHAGGGGTEERTTAALPAVSMQATTGSDGSTSVHVVGAVVSH